MEMTQVCPTGGLGSCSGGTTTDAQPAAVTTTGVSRPVEAEGRIGKITARIEVFAEQAGNAKEPVEAP